MRKELCEAIKKSLNELFEKVYVIKQVIIRLYLLLRMIVAVLYYVYGIKNIIFLLNLVVYQQLFF